MARSTQALQAIKLRRKGWSIGEIARALTVSKSSACLWCRNVRLTPRQLELIEKRAIEAGHKGRLLGAEANRLKKMMNIREYTEKGKMETATLTQKELLLAGVALYWGEGSKIGQLSFVNSDKDMIVFMLRWFQVALGVKNEDFMPRVYVNAQHLHRKRKIERHWSRILHIPLTQFRSTVFIQRSQTKRYANHSKYYGLLSLRVRNSTLMKYKILGLIEGLKYSSF